jgi:hypothetical protein
MMFITDVFAEDVEQLGSKQAYRPSEKRHATGCTD